MRHCSICRRQVDEEKSPILAMGGFGNPRYLCDVCAEDIDTVIGAREAEKIEVSMASLSDKLSTSGADDPLVIETLKTIFSKSGERARKISEGAYDFSEDEEEKEAEQLLDIPDELKETEEDKALDEEDRKAAKRLDKILNWVSTAIILFVIIFLIIRFVL